MSRTRKPNARQRARLERLAHANALIRIIASHGHRYFWHGGVHVWDPAAQASVFKPADRYARLELRRGRVYFIDDYTGKPVYTHPSRFGNRWRGFSHGGTLRALVEDMRDYVTHGTPIARWKIVIQQLDRADLEDNVWGYEAQAAARVREQAYALPIVEAAVGR
jgi:hypothetical protein